MFAQIFCDDVGLAQATAPNGVTYRDQVASSIKSQISEFSNLAEIAIVTEEDERDHVESDLRVIINVSLRQRHAMSLTALGRLIFKSRRCI